MDDKQYTFTRVPRHARVNLWTVSLVRTGMTTALAQFMLGATLGHAMTFTQAMLATLLGSLLLQGISFGVGLAGYKEGLSTSLLAKWCGFGRYGSALVGLAIIISCMGWFGVQNAILADGVVHATQGKITFALAACLSGGILTLLVIFGFIGLSWTAKLALPLFAVIVGWIFYSMLRDSSLLALMTLPPHGPMMSLGAGATMVAGGAVVGALITPDITRYCQSGKHVFWMITISYLIGEFAINGIAILVAHALHTADVVIIMTQSAGWLGLVTVILSALKVNDTALYSASLAVTHLLEVFTKKKFSYRRITCMLGVIGTLLSVLGILGQFTGFLIMLGILFPPIAGVMMVDYYLIRNSRALLDATRHQGKLPASEATPAVGWTALCAWLVGSIAGFTVQIGIPSLNALLAASAVYWLLHNVGVAVRWRCS